MLDSKSMEEHKITAEEQMIVFNKQIAGELSVRKILQDRVALKNHIEGKFAAGEPLPANSAYQNYEEWIKECDKDLTLSNSALKHIDVAKTGALSYQYFVDYYPAKPVVV